MGRIKKIILFSDIVIIFGMFIALFSTDKLFSDSRIILKE